MALTLGAVVGLTEVGIIAWRWFVNGTFSGWSRFLPWMIPAGYSVLFLAIAAGSAALVAIGIFRGAAPFTFLATTVGAFGVFQLGTSGRIYPIALGSLAAAIAWQLARMEAQHGRLRSLSRYASPWVALLVVGGAALSAVAEARADHPDDSGPEPAYAAPNVVLIVWDTVRDLPLFDQGYSALPTPNLDRLASQGADFLDAWSVAPWTLPSHASLLTGHYPDELHADWLRPLEDSVTTLAEVFQANGYRTGAFMANLYYTGRETGLAQGFDFYRDREIGWRQVLLSTEVVQWLRGWESSRGLRATVRKPGRRVTDGFLRWVDAPSDRPFFALLNYFDAHIPYFSPPEYRSRFNGGKTPADRYMAAIAYLDDELGRTLRSLQEAGVLENTVVVVTSDHGEQFGRHGLFDHGNSLYHQVLTVPLVMSAPGRIPAGTRVSSPVTTRDLAATVLAVAGIPGHPLPGVSLTGFWTADSGFTASPVRSILTHAPNAPSRHRNARGTVMSLVEGRYHYILNPDGSSELFDIHADPFERRNLAKAEPEVVKEMREILRKPTGGGGTGGAAP